MRFFRPFLLVLLILAILFRVTIFFTVLYLFLGLAVLSHLWMRGRVEQVAAGRRFVGRAFVGERVPVQLMLRNQSWLPVPWLEVYDSQPTRLVIQPFARQVISLGGYETRRFTYTLECRRRGYYTVGPLTLEGGDLLGLVRATHRQVDADVLIVYPQVLPLEQLNLPTHSPQAVLSARSPLFQDPARVTGVRDYEHGDSPRRIHWTASASAGRLLVKRYQPAIARETLICLDMDTANYDGWRNAVELGIIVAASVAHHVLLREGLPLGLATAAQDPLTDRLQRFILAPRQEQAHLMSILEVLARVQAAEETAFSTLVRQQSVRLSWGATVMVITGRERPELVDTLIYLRRAGFAVAVILVQPGRPSEDLQQRAGLLQVPVHRIWQQEDVQRWATR